MKVMVHLAIEVDKSAWDRAYGTGTASKAVSDDVRQYVTNQVVESPAAHEGCFVSVEQR